MTRDSQPAARRCGDGGADGGLVEGGEDAAAGVGALGDLEAEVAGDDGGEAAGHAVGVGAGAAAELEDVAEALGGDQAGAGEAALEDGVGGGGGAVDDEVDGGEVDAGLRRGRRGRRWPGCRGWSGSWRGGRCRRRGRRATRSVKVPPTSMPATMPAGPSGVRTRAERAGRAVALGPRARAAAARPPGAAARRPPAACRSTFCGGAQDGGSRRGRRRASSDPDVGAELRGVGGEAGGGEGLGDACRRRRRRCGRRRRARRRRAARRGWWRRRWRLQGGDGVADQRDHRGLQALGRLVEQQDAAARCRGRGRWRASAARRRRGCRRPGSGARAGAGRGRGRARGWRRPWRRVRRPISRFSATVSSAKSRRPCGTQATPWRGTSWAGEGVEAGGVEADAAGGGGDEAHDRLERGRLAGAVAAHQAEHLAGGDGEREAAQDLDRRRSRRRGRRRRGSWAEVGGLHGRVGADRGGRAGGERRGRSSSTVMRSARSMTTSMLCSIRSTVAVRGDLADERLEGVDLAVGEALGRLVEDQELRAEREAHGDLEQALVAVGEGAGGLRRRGRRGRRGRGRRGCAAARSARPRRWTARATLSKTRQARVDRGDLEGVGDAEPRPGRGRAGG